MSSFLNSFISEEFLNTLTQLSLELTDNVLVVHIGEKKLQHFRNKELLKEYRVGTGIKPPSCIENSHGTPLGLHLVKGKIGKDAPLGMVFKGRVSIGKCYWECEDNDIQRNLVTTRILRLSGLEQGKNQGPGVDSFDRYIYIHGTNHEENIGKDSSHGCVLLRNSEVIELYNSVPEGSLVWIGL